MSSQAPAQGQSQPAAQASQPAAAAQTQASQPAAGQAAAKKADKPAGSPKPAGAKSTGAKSGDKPAGSPKPAGAKAAGAKSGAAKTVKPAGAKPASKPAGAKTVKPAGAKPASKPSGKSQQAKPAVEGQSNSATEQKKKAKRRTAIKSVQTFGKKKSAIAVAYTCEGVGMMRVNGSPIELVEPQVLRYKVLEPILLLGKERFSKIDIRIRVQGGGHVSQIYAIRQALAKAVVAYYQKYVDESEKQRIKDILMDYDRSLLAIDARRCEPKKFGGRGARARFQKSYR